MTTMVASATGSTTGPATEPSTDGCQVVFSPSGLRGEVPVGITVLDAARKLGVDLDSVCGGRGLCGRCQVVANDDPSALSPWGELEAAYRGGRKLETGHRLGCAARVLGDLVVDVPATSQVHKQVVRKAIDLVDVAIDPVVTLHYIEPGPRVDPAATASEQITTQLALEWGLSPVTIDPALLPHLHQAVASDGLTAAVRRGHQPGATGYQVVGLWPEFVDRAVGAAIDIGSTTVAGHLCDLTTGEVLASSGRMNPQVALGEDLMSRVSFAMMNPDGAAELTMVIHRALGELVTELLIDAGGINRSQLLEVLLVGNPIMGHLALGIDPTPLGQAPFTLATAEAVEAPVSVAGIDAPWARLYAAPCIAGHVGADTTAAILAAGPHRSDNVQLLVDVGTNAEIVLGSKWLGLYAASSPTGPAFEGAQLSSGQRASAGAIERVRIDRETLEPRFKVIGIDPWSDEPGFAAGARKVGVTGICGSGIIEVLAELHLCGLIDPHGVIVAGGAERTPRIVADGRTFSYVLAENIRITQADVRAIQLAKAALRAGIDLLMERAGLETVDEVRLAGAFGAHISPEHAMALGLIPPCAPDSVRSVGNAAGAGAVRALLSGQQRAEMEQVAATVTKIETATEPRFQHHFVAAMAIPHQSALAGDDRAGRRRQGRRKREQP